MLTTMKRFWIARAARLVVFAALGIALFGLLLMSLWNSLVPGLFGGPAITFGQALGLFVLSRILFLPFRAWGGWRPRGQRREGYFRKRFEEKLASMTPEERERFRSRYAACCGSRRSRTPQEELRVRTEEPANV
jgi:hypothetical protein